MLRNVDRGMDLADAQGDVKHSKERLQFVAQMLLILLSFQLPPKGRSASKIHTDDPFRLRVATVLRPSRLPGVQEEGLSRSFDKEYWNYAKLISSVLRHGMPLPYVVNLVTNLDLHNDNINTWKNGVARALKKYIENGKGAADRLCPECHDPDGLIYEEGCLKCKSCGHSKCE